MMSGSIVSESTQIVFHLSRERKYLYIYYIFIYVCMHVNVKIGIYKFTVNPF